MPQVTLIGYRGTGKSTVAAVVAARLGCDWLDADAVLESRLSTTIAAFVRDRGEPAFRAAEAEILADLLGSFRGVLATGGGVVLRPENRRLLRELGRPVVWLTAPADVIRGRLAADPTTPDRRPALTSADPLAEVEAALAARLPLYTECADVAFDTGTEPPAAVAERIVHWLAAREGDGR
ncbi:MAG: shikimate kinase [Pirellulales bacterium]